ncbi:PTS system, fructose-specific IIC component [Trichococcus ilyis]|uniref:PTS system, fructose-specific IIC component n=1 Tax=Trichococcus ilyis TaxID=640938 RepID=A0A143YLS5_9LACT|nr:phosphotransferase system fructose-specific iib subunit [Trichococcus ilyis]SEI75136.1 PTS system, fructose-specific IIC component [Trichococcus ilyis]
MLSVSGIDLNVDVLTKEEAIDHLVELMDKSGKLSDRKLFKEKVLSRETQFTTGIGDGIAIPHAKTTAVKEAGLAAMVVKNGVDFDSLDGKPAYLFFMIAASENENNLHLDALARLSAMLMDEVFRKRLMQAETKMEFLTLIDEKESAIAKDKENSSSESYRVLAVTACPTGIAHTYMAAEELENRGKLLGIPVKAETQGADGAKNVLTAEEIAKADGIIIAADKNVDLSRFDGKPVIVTKVSDGIHKSEELINRIVNKEAKIYHNNQNENAKEESESLGHGIYKHLMNGVSHMLPFVIGGGILIALAFLFDDYTIDPSNFGKNTPVAAYLKTVGEFSFGMMLPILAGYIAMSIADRPGLAVGFIGGMVANAGVTFSNPAGGDVNAGFLGALFAGFVGGYIVLALKKACSKIPHSLEGIKPMLIYPVAGILLTAVVTTMINPFVGAINDSLNGALNGMESSSKILLGIVVAGMQSTDMGGPINKASYVFATSQLAEGNFEIMAAVMAGGMIPPLAIALCTTFFKNRFTEKERQSGMVNYLLGLSFISEGAIPFAASDPLRVIPACIIGSATAGGLSMLFGCTLRAPHGGIFVLPTMGNPLAYALAIVIGSFVGCFVLALLKKPKMSEEMQ